MSPLPHDTSGSRPASDTLTERMLARVADARIDIDVERRSKAPRTGPRRKRAATPAGALAESPDPRHAHETASLRRVFRDLGITYRRYRKQTHEPVKPELRDAAYSFRAEPSFASLVAVAAYLDELDLLS